MLHSELSEHEEDEDEDEEHESLSGHKKAAMLQLSTLTVLSSQSSELESELDELLWSFL